LIGFNSLVVQDPEIARIFLEGGADRESLPEIDRRRFDSLMGITVESLLQRFEFVEDGIASARARERLQLIIPRIFQQPGARSYWRDWRSVHSGDFRDYVDGLIREGEAAG
jgi:hypothetical protein